MISGEYQPGFNGVLTGKPTQNAYIERLNGSILSEHLNADIIKTPDGVRKKMHVPPALPNKNTAVKSGCGRYPNIIPSIYISGYSMAISFSYCDSYIPNSSLIKRRISRHAFSPSFPSRMEWARNTFRIDTWL